MFALLTTIQHIHVCTYLGEGLS